MVWPALSALIPEAELLLCCLHSEVPSGCAVRIAALAEDKLDWELLLAMARKHRVMPILYKSLMASCPDSVPAKVKLKLERRLEPIRLRSLNLADEMLHLTNLLLGAGIRAMPFKGPVLSASVYGDMYLRQTWDIDLLIEEKNLPDTRELLHKLGYHSTRRFDQAENFFHSEKEIEVDLHWGLGTVYFPIGLEFEALWTGGEKVYIGDDWIWSFGDEHLLLILCAQVAKDCWERRQHLEYLAKVTDIAELVRHRPELDWAFVTGFAEREGLKRIVHFGLGLAHGLLEVELPPKVQAALDADRLALSLARQVSIRLFTDHDRVVAKPQDSYFDLAFRFRQLLFYLKLRERPGDWLQHVLAIGRLALPQFARNRR